MARCGMLLVLAWVVAAPPVLDAGSTQLLTGVLAAAAAQPGIDVLTSDDLRRAADVEANRQLMGCDPGAGSCLAELASAMGAALVLHGSAGALGDEIVLTLSLYDSNTATSAGHELVRAADVTQLSHAAEDAAKRLVATRAPAPGAPRVKVLVLDLALAGQSDAPPSAAADEGPGALPWVLIGGGVVVAGAGVALDVLAPWSNDFELGATDAIGPTLVVLGAGASVGGVVWLVGSGE